MKRIEQRLTCGVLVVEPLVGSAAGQWFACLETGTNRAGTTLRHTGPYAASPQAAAMVLADKIAEHGSRDYDPSAKNHRCRLADAVREVAPWLDAERQL